MDTILPRKKGRKRLMAERLHTFVTRTYCEPSFMSIIGRRGWLKREDDEQKNTWVSD